MSVFLRRYGTATVTATHISIPIIKRGAVDFAVSADWFPAAGDVKITKDGDYANTANITTLPVAKTHGNTAVWEFQFSSGELSCKKLEVTVADAATKTVEDQFFGIETFGHASAMYTGDPNNLDAPVSGRMAAYSQPAGFLAATFPGGTIANTTNLTGGTITSVSGAVGSVAAGVTVTTNNDKTGYSLLATGLDAIVSTATGMVEIAKAIWDRILSGATHNIAGSAGRRLRQAGGLIQIDGTVMAGPPAPTTTAFVTDLPSAVDDFYNHQVLVWLTGALAGGKPVVTMDYTGATKLMVVEPAATSAPAVGDTFSLIGLHVHPVSSIQAGLATAAALTALADIVEADLFVDTTAVPNWDLVWIKKGTGDLTTGTILMRKDLKDVTGGNITNTTTVIGQARQ